MCAVREPISGIQPTRKHFRNCCRFCMRSVALGRRPSRPTRYFKSVSNRQEISTDRLFIRTGALFVCLIGRRRSWAK